jgi:hypothetical protein
MTEAEFIAHIDCKFPYHDLVRAVSLIEIGCSISSNAGFAILHELIYLPSSQRLEMELRIRLLTLLRTHLLHPLVQPVSILAEQCIAGNEVTVANAIAVMRIIGPFTGQYSALAIAYMSCNDLEGEAEAVYDEIVRTWKVV